MPTYVPTHVSCSVRYGSTDYGRVVAVRLGEGRSLRGSGQEGRASPERQGELERTPYSSLYRSWLLGTWKESIHPLVKVQQWSLCLLLNLSARDAVAAHTCT